MSFLEDPIKAKKAFTTVIIIASVLLILTAGTLSYFCYMAYKKINEQTTQITTLVTEKETLTTQVNSLSDYQTQIATLQAENDTLDKSVASYKAKISKIDLYNKVHDYIYDVIVKHSGFTGWTDAEYQKARTKALATGDTGLLSTVDSAWNDHNGLPAIRFARVMWEIIDGIDNQVK